MGTAENLIPKSVQDFAREFTELAIKHGLRQGHIQLTFGYRADRIWDEPVSIVWEDGRHGADAHKYRIETTLRLRGDAELNKEPRP